MPVQEIPLLQWSQRNEARRLVTLIDTLYDMRCRLECSAAGKPRQVHLQSLHSVGSPAAHTPDEHPILVCTCVSQEKSIAAIHCSTDNCACSAVHADTHHASSALVVRHVISMCLF